MISRFERTSSPAKWIEMELHLEVLNCLPINSQSKIYTVFKSSSMATSRLYAIVDTASVSGLKKAFDGTKGYITKFSCKFLCILGNEKKSYDSYE